MFEFRAITFMALICCLSIFGTACTISQPTTVTPVSQPHEGAAEQLKKSVTTEADGTIVSKDWVEVQGQNPKINIYRVMYMSGGVKAEAFLSEPKASGTYPLLVDLHGGWSYEMPSIMHETGGYTAESLKTASDDRVVIRPNYRGYMGSDGTVQGLAGDTLDTQNAIKAVMSLGKAKPGSIYVKGYSMGGGVALRLASERQDIKAVIAVSPFVGWDEVIRWMDNNPNENSSHSVVSRRFDASLYKDIFKKNPAAEKENSLLDRIPNIQAPMLFLQGTGDDRVVWQTVQEFADEMKAANKTVKLVLYPDGSHGLHDKYQQETIKESRDWFQQYGLPAIKTQ